jgi:RNA polymerase sigma factor (sigma-70 family)
MASRKAPSSQRPNTRSYTGVDAVDDEIARWVQKAGTARSLDTTAALSAFQRRMERYPQLSPESQLELAEHVRLGFDARERLASEKVPARERKSLEALAKDVDRSMEYLAGSNFRLVMLICRELAEERYPGRSLEVLGDLIGEANIALTQAMREFDVERCPVFATYVAKVVRDRVRAMLAKDSHVRVANSWHRLKRIAAVRIPQLQAELGRAPTEAEIKADLLQRCMEWAESKLTPEQAKLPKAKRQELMVAKLRKQGMIGAIESLQDVLQASQTVASLDARVGDDGDTTLGDMVPTGEEDGFSNLELEELRDTLRQALGHLDEREQTIVLLRFGFVDGEQWTYTAIAERYDVTAERIRQIEKNVLHKLATSSALRDRLAAFLPSASV